MRYPVHIGCVALFFVKNHHLYSCNDFFYKFESFTYLYFLPLQRRFKLLLLPMIQHHFKIVELPSQKRAYYPFR